MSVSLKADPSGTFGEILVNGAVVAKLPVTGNAVIPGLVGTVSQSGGVPTGAVVERGSNINGEYVRFADGTQICISIVTTTPTNTAAGSIFASADTSVTFPASFSASPSVAGASDVSGVWSSFGTVTLSGVSVKVFNTATSPNTRTVRYVAIGRWF